VNPLRSVGARLALTLFFVVLGAFGIVYLVVVPSLERRLINAKVSQLDKEARRVVRGLPKDRPAWQVHLDDEARLVNARLILYDVQRSPRRVHLRNVADSQAAASGLGPSSLARRAATTYSAQGGSVTQGGVQFAQVAHPLGPDVLLVVSSSLRDQLGTVALVERRLVLSGLLALFTALAGGYLAAWAFARRIRRLERAAERIAGGRFDEPVEDKGADEVGELASAFERMRARLAQLDHARREFIANASHELRTPLFALSGFVELLREEELDEGTRRDFLDTMHGQVTRLTRLATDLLDLSRLDAGRLTVERTRVELSDLARTLVGEFTALAQAQERVLEASVDGSVCALGDEQRVLQIGRILVENALHHTTPGTSIRVTVEELEDRALLAVEDEGPGIAPDRAPHVFDRFYRIEGNVASGSGLGLAIARELAELMQGTIVLQSAPGRTRFTLRLPRDHEDDPFSRENARQDGMATVS